VKRFGMALAMILPVVAAVALGFSLVTTSHALPRRPGHLGSPPQSVPADTAACTSRSPATPFVGVAVNPPVKPAVAEFKNAVKVRPGLVELYLAFGSSFRASSAGQVVESGAMPLVQINLYNVHVADIAAGKWDHYLRRFAASVRAFKCQVALSLGHEMNGIWYPWGYSHLKPSVFVSAWRHIVDVFRSQQAGNVTWVWTVNVRSRWSPSPVDWWPGSSYVDWIGIDGYYRTKRQTYNSMFAPTVRIVRGLSSTKPAFIAETAVSPSALPSAQLQDLFSSVRMNHLTGFVWFNVVAKDDWLVQDDPAVQRVFGKDAGRYFGISGTP